MTIRFNRDLVRDFETRNFTALSGRTGLYFIFHNELLIPYPFNNSRLIYIGMSESRINSIGNRLKNHFSGRSNNKGIFGYKKRWELKFTYLDWEFLKHFFPTEKIQTIESLFLESFAENYGSYPICNNRRGDSIIGKVTKLKNLIYIDWNFYGESKT
ncbi:MAG: hypothetical protein Q8O30_12570 [Candidatus Omnitrophota bacterium]|nr:hypothetical protein [Candidatus Omnitrophota bacterium]